MRHGCTAVFCGVAALVAPGRMIVAQERTIPATVVEIAGTNLYFDAGSQQGLAANDTVVVSRADDGTRLGQVLIVETTSTTAVATFAGAPFSITRGVPLRLAFGAAPSAPGGAVPTGGGIPTTRAVGGIEGGPAIRGRFSIEADGSRTVTHWLSNTELRTTRTYATPSALLQLEGTGLPGGFAFHTQIRTTYRYSSPDIVDPAQAFEVYELSVTREVGSLLAVQAGRFYSRFERYGGYYDGALVLIGSERLGVGAAAGFLPSRGNQGFSTDYPKYGVFATWGARGGALRYTSNISFDRMLPRNGLPDETFGGWSQRLFAGPFRASSDLRIDRRSSGGWLVTQLQIRGGVRLTPGLSLDARVARFESPGSTFSFLTLGGRRDQAGVGLSAVGRAGSASLDVGVVRPAGAPTSQSVSAWFALTRPILAGAVVSGSFSLWRRAGASDLQATIDFQRQLGRVQARLGYDLYRMTGIATGITHAGHLSLDFPLGPRVGGYTRFQLQRGTNLDALRVYAGLRTSF